MFFSSDPANPDTYPHFYADLQMYNTTMTAPDPQWFMNQFTSWEIASKDNKWQGRNVTRFRSDEYDRAYRAADSELDPVKRAALFIRMNDIVIQNAVVIRCSGGTVCRFECAAPRDGPDGVGLDILASRLLVQAGVMLHNRARHSMAAIAFTADRQGRSSWTSINSGR